MSIQAEQLVYDFLSRVGDAAHGVLSPTARLKFVSELRARIDAERAGTSNESMSTVRSLLNGLGDPEQLVRERVTRDGAVLPAQTVPAAAQAPPRLAATRPLAGAGPLAGGRPDLPAPHPSEPAGPAGWPDVRAASPAAISDDILNVPAVPVDDEIVPPPSVEDTLPGAGGAGIPPIIDQPSWPADAPTSIVGLPTPRTGPGVTGEVIVPTVAPTRRGSASAMFGRLDAGYLTSHKRESLATLVLLASGVFSSIVLVVIGYAIALTSYTWTAKDKRFGLIGLPALTVLVFVVGLWLQATGRWGGAPVAGSRLSGDLRDLVSVFPRVVGLLAALFFGWRLARIAARR